MRKSYPVALGGVLAALAVVIMTFGGMIPAATYACPVLCSVLLFFVDAVCGHRIGWAWYGTVAMLGLLLSPDKESAAVFIALGYYPIIKFKLDRLPFCWLWKLLLFNLISAILYVLLIFIFGIQYLASEFQELGIIGLVITLALGNVCFFMLDRVLHLMRIKIQKAH